MQYDAIVCGGGLTGVVSAIGLSQKGIKVALFDQALNLLDASNDNRVFALSKKSKDILSKLGIWHHLVDEAEPILDIFIRDVESPVSVHFGYDLVGECPMGYTVTADALYRAVRENIRGFDLYTNSSYKSVVSDGSGVRLTMVDGQELAAQLLICAEGKNSKLRKIFNIPVIERLYNQSSIVCNFIHENHHENLAVERFFPGGPFAILPMKSGYQSSVVWTDQSEMSEMLMKLSDEEFTIEAGKKFGTYLGKIKLANRRQSYRLSLVFAEYLQAKRLLLLGDAAHSLHPIAGQGFNLTLRDIEGVIQSIVSAKGMGALHILTGFSHERYLDNLSMAIMTDGINRLFSNKSVVLKVARNMGLLAVENCSAIKKHLINHAMGFGKL